MVMIFKDTYEDLTGERLAEIIEAFDKGEGASVRKGPQIDRHLSVPASGLTTLNTFGDDDDVGEAGEPRARSSAPAQGTATPSQAGRVDTNAAETDPRIQAPGKASPSESSTAQAAEKRGEPAEGAERPGSGQTGGTEQGPTGQVERDKAEFGAASGSVDGEPRSDGPLADKGEAAERAVVDERKFVGDQKAATPPAQDLSNREAGASGTLEGERSGTSDTAEGNDAPKRPGGDAGKAD
jgi:NADH-quinone oxidoreductase subunit E